MLGMLPTGSNAQTIHPVQSTLQLLPPYSVYLSDYAQPGGEKLRVILLQRDLSQAVYQLRLAFSVELNGRVILRTASTFNPAPLSLDPGVPTILSGADLAPYLDSRNLEFVGYSRQQYEKTRALPEGSYRLCVSAYDYRRQDVEVAAPACAYYFLAKSEPPLINSPSCGTKLAAKSVQQVVFSWLPRNTASANSAATTEYEFSLFEVRPSGANPNQIVVNSKPIYQVSTAFTQLVYGPAEPQLQEHMQYAWRVQAKDSQGRDAFRNNGYSEVCSFTYGGADPAFVVGKVEGFQVQAQTETKATFSWKRDTKGFESYRLEYKKAGQGYKWFRSDTKEGELKVFDLEADTEYEARVQGQVKGFYGPASDVVTFRTPKARVVSCGENLPVAQLQQGKPLAFATPGMIINARGMEVILEEVEHLPEDGFYKGRGLVAIPYLGGANFRVKFDRIYLDEDRNVVSGRIDVVSDSNQMTDVGALAAAALSPLTEKLDDLLSKLKAPQENREQIATAIDDYIEHVQAFIEKNPGLPDSVQQQLREDALLLETSKAGFLAATDQASTGMIIATIQEQAQQAKDRIAAIKEQVGNGSNQLDKMIAAGKKDKLIAIISDTIMQNGKVFIYNGASRQMKVKFETLDVAKSKVPYQIAITAETSNRTIYYPKTGYDTLICNQTKEITLDSIPQGKYTIVYQSGKIEHSISFHVRKQKLEVTREQLKKIFPNTDSKRLEEVAKAINANSLTFGIGTPERMAHFIGQIGAETGGLNKLKESSLYSPRAVAKNFHYAHYGHLFESALLDSTTYTHSYDPVNYDENNCDGDKIARGGAVFPYKSSKEIMNAYASTKADTIAITVNNKKTKIPVYKMRTDVTKANIEKLVKDGEYNSGLLRVKKCYIRSASLFDVTYACRMENGTIASQDGSTFLGKGFIHITGKGGYKDISIEWNKLYPNDKKEFHGKDINLLETDVEVAIKASMVYWKLKALNGKADLGTSPTIVEKIGKTVNGGDNGMDLRQKYTKLAADNLK